LGAGLLSLVVMGAETRVDRAAETGIELEPWQGGVVGGLAGALLFGALMAAATPGVLAGAIPALYGFSPPAPGVGWVFHMSHGAIIGVGFAAVAEGGLLGEPFDTVLGRAGAGLIYGLVVWVAFAVLVMPVWLTAVGFPNAPAVPNVGVESFLGHALFGLVLGATYAVLSD
jgi:uncharacterized membrane protein YagU involved in acid resistance